MISPLPDSYHFVDQTAIAPEEIISLRQKVGWEGDTPERWTVCLAQSLAVIGVKTADGLLVGVGCLAGNIRHSVLCDLAVDPAHQGKGIGKALLLERLRLADEMGILYLYAELAPTNTLRSKYAELGFQATGNGLFRAQAHTSE